MLKTILGNWLIPAIALTIALLAASLFVPAWASVIEGIVFFLILGAAILPILRSQTKLHREDRISRTKMAWNILYEIMGMLLAMILAVSMGRTIVEIATAHISNDLTKFIAGMVIGLLAGMGVGFLLRRIWSRQPISTLQPEAKR